MRHLAMIGALCGLALAGRALFRAMMDTCCAQMATALEERLLRAAEPTLLMQAATGQTDMVY